MSKNDGGPATVWLAFNEGVEHGNVAAVFVDKGSALKWLRLQHQLAWEDAARTDAYWRKDYAERAATEEDPEMAAYYAEKAGRPDNRKVGEIDDYGTGARFEIGSFDTLRIGEYKVQTWDDALAQREREP